MTRLAFRRFAALFAYALTKAPFDGRGVSGVIALLLLLPVFMIWQLTHWLGFLLDEILFRGYRKVDVHRPLFVLGPPRTGTTYLHRVLAADRDTTTFKTWECLFGLSIVGRKLCIGLGRVDRALGRPVSRIGSWLGRRLLGAMDDIHELKLDAPEEDFLCLMPLAACFLLIVPFPRDPWLWRAARLDTALDPREQRAIMRYYRRCVQKHLYVFGDGKRYLAKNPSFSGMAQALLDEFPDARILTCSRDPVATVPSQLSALRPGLAACGFESVPDELRDELVDLLRYYYEHLADVSKANPGCMAVVSNDELRRDLDGSIRRAFGELGIAVSTSLDGELLRVSTASEGSQSAHIYSPEEFGLDAAQLRAMFASVYSA